MTQSLRPSNFENSIGQKEVVTAISNYIIV